MSEAEEDAAASVDAVSAAASVSAAVAVSAAASVADALEEPEEGPELPQPASMDAAKMPVIMVAKTFFFIRIPFCTVLVRIDKPSKRRSFLPPRRPGTVGVGTYYPFTAPATTPSTMYFCRKIKITMEGRTASTMAAMAYCHWVFICPTKE